MQKFVTLGMGTNLKQGTKEFKFVDDGGSMEYYQIFNIFGELWPYKLYMSLMNLL